MLNYTCKFCGGALRIREGRMGAQCTVCGRYYNSDELYRIAQTRAPEAHLQGIKPETVIAGSVLAVVAFSLLPFTALPFILLLPIVFIAAGKKLLQAAEENEEGDRPRGAGEQLRTADDYLRAFRMLPLDYMPLRAEAGRAIMQIDALKRKQLALASMLPADHPFLKNCNDAAAYILRNLKQVLYRLRFCDQNDLQLRRMHADYIRARLEENDRILRDFENLIIEVTQMNDDDFTPLPALDVLAETLYTMRTGSSGKAQIDDMDDHFMRGDF